MRSASMAWLFETAGLSSWTLKGGYKSFRRHVLAYLEQDFPFIVIGGLTGSGKTGLCIDLLEEAAAGKQAQARVERTDSIKLPAIGPLGDD